jgi:monoterpene epsilon-lactone hydrolase
LQPWRYARQRCGRSIRLIEFEVLLDDSRRYVERAIAAGTDAQLDVWMGMPHGFAGSIGSLKASALALDAIGMFLTEKLQAGASPHTAR